MKKNNYFFFTFIAMILLCTQSLMSQNRDTFSENASVTPNVTSSDDRDTSLVEDILLLPSKAVKGVVKTTMTKRPKKLSKPASVEELITQIEGVGIEFGKAKKIDQHIFDNIGLAKSVDDFLKLASLTSSVQSSAKVLQLGIEKATNSTEILRLIYAAKNYKDKQLIENILQKGFSLTHDLQGINNLIKTVEDDEKLYVKALKLGVSQAKNTSDALSIIKKTRRNQDSDLVDELALIAAEKASSVKDIVSLSQAAVTFEGKDAVVSKGKDLCKTPNDYAMLSTVAGFNNTKDKLLLEGISICSNVQQVLFLAAKARNSEVLNKVLLEGMSLAKSSGELESLEKLASGITKANITEAKRNLLEQGK
ncbi:MAG: hypothetical protein HQM10_02915 [Candidatus Riflebacteria bacterium]|nr:hypothetical protein [Candidatus Riflebacteria bacterium]